MMNNWMMQWKLLWRDMVSNARTMTVGGYVLIGVLLALLVGVTVIAHLGWVSAAGADVPPFGYVAMAIGILLSLVFGVGLMALLFYSSRSGYDEPARLIPSDRDNKPGSQT
jgi:hypothetical protein